MVSCRESPPPYGWPAVGLFNESTPTNDSCVMCNAVRSTTPDLKCLGGIVPWFGAKRTLAPQIVREFGEHRSYYELGCGSLAVLLAKPTVTHEMAVDLHGDLINLAMCLASPRWRELYEAVDRIALCDRLMDAYRQEMKSDLLAVPTSPEAVTADHIIRASRYLAMSWICRQGTAGSRRSNCRMSPKWTSGGGGQGIRWRAAVDSVPVWHDRLKGVVIVHRSLFGVLSKIEDESGTAIYVDPPYFRSTRSQGGRSHYEYDFLDSDDLCTPWSDERPLFVDEADDHARLARELARFKRARVLVSYYDHPRLARLYPREGWTKRCLQAVKKVRGAEQRHVVATEVLLINGSTVFQEELFE